MAALLEDGEIDEWFEERKQALVERFSGELKGERIPGRAQRRFDADFKHLLEEYELRYSKAAKLKARHEKYQRPLKRLRAWWTERLLAVTLWWKLRKEKRKKRRFDREYRKLFHFKKKV